MDIELLVYICFNILSLLLLFFDPTWLSTTSMTNPVSKNSIGQTDITINDARTNTGIFSALGAMAGGAITGVSNGITTGITDTQGDGVKE